MIIRKKDLVIPEKKPFENCKLGREKYAKVLTSIISGYSEGFVLAVNNSWGTGKTTFVKMWRQSLIKEGYQTIYFNAWENDFEDNALTALMGEIKQLIGGDEDFKKTMKIAARLTKNLAPSLLKAVVSKYIDTKELADFITEYSKGAVDFFEQEVNVYAVKKEGLKEFKERLEKLVSTKVDESKPLIFIIDELDRCRPNYAVSVLEQIKHFFSVNNIVFVLSIDKVQLGHAIRGVYGSDRIDADEYLRRFIDLEYNLPEPEISKYAEFLYNYHRFDEFFENVKRNQNRYFVNDVFVLFNAIKCINGKSISLRKQEKIFLLFRLTVKAFDFNQYVFPDLLFFMCSLKILDSEFYTGLKEKNYNIEEIQDSLSAYKNAYLDDDMLETLCIIEIKLLFLYNNYFRGRENFVNFLNINDDKALINSIFLPNNDRLVKRILEKIDYDSGNIVLDYLLNKIDLMENLKT